MMLERRAAKNRMLKSERYKFQLLCCLLLRDLGGEDCLEHEDTTIDTPLGKLRCHVYDDWVACRFEEPARAYAVIKEVNRYSGKHNCHVFDRILAKHAFEVHFKSHLRSIWIKTGTEIPEPLRRDDFVMNEWLKSWC